MFKQLIDEAAALIAKARCECRSVEDVETVAQLQRDIIRLQEEHRLSYVLSEVTDRLEKAIGRLEALNKPAESE